MKPDFDAYASVFTLYQWISLNFPTKEVIAWIDPDSLTDKEEKLFDLLEEKIKTELTTEELKTGLGIVLDTPNEERILTQQHVFCQELIIMDHHPKINSFAQLEFINHLYSSTSEILVELLLYFETNYGYAFTTQMAQYLYSGIITDSNHLRAHVTPSTYYLLWKLLGKGINRKAINELIVENSFNQKLFDQEVVRNIKVTPNGLAFSIVSAKLLRKYEIREYVSAISNLENIAGIEIWVIFIEDEFLKKWKCSIRSKRLPIDKIATQLGGGGHKLIASTLLNKKREFWSLLFLLDSYLIKFGFSSCSDCGKLGKSRMLTIYKWWRGKKEVKQLDNIK
ncbi:DHH family phosphoesterase [Mycoplasma wenyonii]|uniref:DHH family phosphoesterase n=1 Tax=Mycoplasma wenyonii TaxID=65123 RepID=UPI0021AD0049|nr:DHH family phosphoesterase [Mycoplasma wenyonii]